jgi:hypothetical protein
MQKIAFVPMIGVQMEVFVEDCPAAKTLYVEGMAGNFSNSYAIANQFHMYGKLEAAARFYRRALEQYPVGTGYRPLEKDLLCAQMICEIKGGFEIDGHDLERLLAMDRSYACFIEGCTALYAAAPDYRRAVVAMGNAFEAFVCGHEVHTHFLRAARGYFAAPATAIPMPNPWGAGWTRTIAEAIPRRMFFYWDKNPPGEIADNFAYHEAINEIAVDVYSQQRAEAFLYDYYGSDTKNTFVALRHPAEQSDFFRPHVVYAYGGYYLDADLKIGSVPAFLALAASCHDAMFSVTDTCLVDNGFFAAQKACPLMASCIEIVSSNCHLYPQLPIDMKTGPGAFTRMLARAYFRVLAFGDPLPRMKILDRAEWAEVVATYPVSYKGDQRNWQIFQAHKGIR